MKPLTVNIRQCKTVFLWPDESDGINAAFLLKHFLFLMTLFPSGTTSSLGAIRQLNNLQDITILIDQLIGLCPLIASIYMCECFIQSVQKIRNLSEEISEFGRKFNAQDVLEDTETTLQYYTKGITIYGIVGNICYAFFPMLTKSKCEATRVSTKYENDHDPCGMMIRNWYPVKVSEFPLFQIVFLHQMWTCTVVSILILIITMLLVGLLMYAVALLKHCAGYIEKCCDATSIEEIEENVNFSIRYHIAIILYASNIVEAFSSMMIVYIIVTSFQISILLFEIIMVESIWDSMRFSMHLFGWLVLLFLVCFYGQQLIDESSNIGIQAYSSSWYNVPVHIQKDIQLIILRGQKPLRLSAASIGVMSLESYLGVISTAYSYFTLLLNIKEDKVD